MSEIVPLSRMRKAIAKAMTASASIPQFGIEMGLDARPLVRAREALPKASRPSVIDLLVASCAAALRDRPQINSSFSEEGILLHEEINVALALALEDGLISPAIRSADTLPVEQLTAERKRLTEAARTGTLTPDEILSATFTISNLGPLGVQRFNALLVPPQAAILAVGAVVADRSQLNLTVDHRSIDGAPAAEFLAQVKSQLEDESWLQALLMGTAGFEPATSRV